MIALVAGLLCQSGDWAAIDGLMLLLRREGIELSGDEGRLDPRRTFVAILGDPPADHSWFARFIDRGGRVLIASDRPSVNPYVEGFGIQVETGPVRVLSDGDAFNGCFDCPVANVARDSQTINHPIFRDVKRIAFNRPAWLSSQQIGGLLHLPRLQRRGAPPCLIATRFGRGRLVVLSDHSVFINLMLPEADNLAFSRNLFRWMGRKSVRLFYEGKRIHPGDLPPGLASIPPLSLPALNPALEELETSGALNGFVQTFLPWIVGGMTILAFAALVVWMTRATGLPGGVES